MNEILYRLGFYAYYDTLEEKIKGCKEYGMIWHHENRHQWQNKKGILLLNTYSIIISLGLTVALQIWEFALLGFWFLILIETDAWIFGTINWLKNKPEGKK